MHFEISDTKLYPRGMNLLSVTCHLIEQHSIGRDIQLMCDLIVPFATPEIGYDYTKDDQGTPSWSVSCGTLWCNYLGIEWEGRRP